MKRRIQIVDSDYEIERDGQAWLVLHHDGEEGEVLFTNSEDAKWYMQTINKSDPVRGRRVATIARQNTYKFVDKTPLEVEHVAGKLTA